MYDERLGDAADLSFKVHEGIISPDSPEFEARRHPHSNNRVEILFGLLWEAVYHEHPDIATFTRVFLHNDWVMTCKESECRLSGIELFPDSNHSSRTFFKNLELLFCGKDNLKISASFTDVCEGEEVIMILEDPFLKKLYSLGYEIEVAYTNGLQSFKSSEEAMVWHEKLPLIEHILLARKRERITFQISLVKMILFQILSEEYDVVKNSPSIRIRKGWQVVSREPS